MSIVVERVAYDDFIATCRHLYVPHYKEVPYGGGNLEQDIDHDTYRYLEQAGELHIYVARHGNKPVGYMAVGIHPMLHHSKRLRAVTDTFYVQPTYRSKGVFKALVDAVEVACVAHGLAAFQIVTNVNFKDAEKVAEHLGFTELETTYVKEFPN